MNLEKLNNQFVTNIPERILDYLLSRGLSRETIKKFELGYIESIYEKSWITIPIKDSQGKILFFKLRRDPIRKEGEKYSLYPSGNKACLFNSEILVSTESVVICEGEFDCMILDQNGMHAVSSTAGATTFKNEWMKQLAHLDEITICFDKDESGQQGMEKVAEKLILKTSAQINTIDLNSVLKDGKDITDYFLRSDKEPDTYNVINFLALKTSYNSKIFSGLQTAKEVLNENIEYGDPWLIDDLLPSGAATMLSGDSGIGKSYLVLYLASCIVSGNMAFDQFKSKKGKVLLVDEENIKRWLHERFAALSIDSDDFMLYNYQGLKIDKKQDIEKIIRTAISRNVALVIFDSLVRFHDLDENTADQMKGILEAIKPLLIKGIAVLFIHHSGKSNEGKESTYRGSSEIKAGVDCQLFIKQVGGKGTLLLQCKKLRFAPEFEPLAIKMEKKDGKMFFSLLDSTFFLKATKVDPTQSILTLLKNSNQPLSIIDFQQQLEPKIGESKLRTILKEQIAVGTIVQESGASNKKIYSLKK